MKSFERQITSQFSVKVGEDTQYNIVLQIDGAIRLRGMDVPNVQALKDALDDARTYQQIMIDDATSMPRASGATSRGRQA
jgi:hypothetical protein